MSLRTPVRATLRPMSVQASSSVASRIDNVPAKLVCSGLKPTFCAGSTSSVAPAGSALERRAHDRLVDQRVGRERQVRAVLLDGRHGQQRNRRLGVDAPEVGRREVLPVAAAHAS